MLKSFHIRILPSLHNFPITLSTWYNLTFLHQWSIDPTSTYCILPFIEETRVTSDGMFDLYNQLMYILHFDRWVYILYPSIEWMDVSPLILGKYNFTMWMHNGLLCSIYL